MGPANSAARAAAYVAIRKGLLRSSPGVVLDARAYVAEPHQNLIEGVSLSDFEADIRQGSGNELAGKFSAGHSSSALAANTFAPFKSRIADLRLLDTSGFKDLHFERRCHNGVAAHAPANLDVLVESPQGVIAIESKCTEHLAPHVAEFSPAYDGRIRDNRRDTSWFRVMKFLIDNPTAYCWLDAAQLVKHALALLHTYPERPVTLVYLFWEPANPSSFAAFEQHRAEVARFAESVNGTGPTFVSISYLELWDTWDLQRHPDWLSAHVERLRVRYGVMA